MARDEDLLYAARLAYDAECRDDFENRERIRQFWADRYADPTVRDRERQYWAAYDARQQAKLQEDERISREAKQKQEDERIARDAKQQEEEVSRGT